MGLLQRAIDETGIPTISITQSPEITAIVKPSRAVYVGNPFGLTLGNTGDASSQRSTLRAVLQIATGMQSPGILDSGIRWTLDDLRARQLRKEVR